MAVFVEDFIFTLEIKIKDLALLWKQGICFCNKDNIYWLAVWVWNMPRNKTAPVEFVMSDPTIKDK